MSKDIGAIPQKNLWFDFRLVYLYFFKNASKNYKHSVFPKPDHFLTM